MGNAQVKNDDSFYDKRTLRRIHRESFLEAIESSRTRAHERWKDEQKIGEDLPGSGNPRPTRGDIFVCVRKRPIFENEVETKGEFDVVTCLPMVKQRSATKRYHQASGGTGRTHESGGADGVGGETLSRHQRISKTIVVSDCRMHADNRRKMLINHRFNAFDAVFNEDQSTADVYQECLRPLVAGVVSSVFRRSQASTGDSTDNGTDNDEDDDGAELVSRLSPAASTVASVLAAAEAGAEAMAGEEEAATRRRSFDHVSTCLMYGQTGTGKTYTISGLQRFAVQDLFEMCSSAAQGSDDSDSVSSDQFAVSVSCFEISGNVVRDLMDHNQEVSVLSDGHGHVILRGLRDKVAESAEQLIELAERAMQSRRTRATAVNDTSSRTHAIVRINVTFGDESNVDTVTRKAQLNLVDLAGSEWSMDSLVHDANRRKESMEINTSLYILKECIHSRSMYERSLNCNVRGTKEDAENPSASRGNSLPVSKRDLGRPVSYRASTLTRILQESLQHPGQRPPNTKATQTSLCVVATVSPLSGDSEHTISTLKHIGSLTSGGSFGDEVDASVKISGKTRPPRPATSVAVSASVSLPSLASSSSSLTMAQQRRVKQQEQSRQYRESMKEKRVLREKRQREEQQRRVDVESTKKGNGSGEKRQTESESGKGSSYSVTKRFV
eukprot:TRINITY_DN12708_c0_g1_i1.p1 TRINITY_DN12708_c0_g1~~TRINITY_DN12708_c0_g1_i1.p1  ORF type:complete len:718 (+),score=91.40 TRINITY_DN12708_c0_g1_i1:150-2156(+)